MAGFSDGANDLVDVGLLPHPAVVVVFDLGDQQVVIEDSSGQQLRERVVAGLAPRGARGRGVAGSFECLQVRLSPVVAHAVLGASSELSGSLVALDDLWGREAAAVQEQLRAAGSWDQRFAIAESTLARRHDPKRVADPEVSFCWAQMVASQGQVWVERLAADVGWSRKRLWSRFRSQVGLTPKSAARLVRFDHAAHRLAAGQSPALVAVESGYADQSHLHRDVADFSGLTPAAVAREPSLAVDDVAWPSRHAELLRRPPFPLGREHRCMPLAATIRSDPGCQ
jgi:AraC-like DNA-binding protein